MEDHKHSGMFQVQKGFHLWNKQHEIVDLDLAFATFFFFFGYLVLENFQRPDAKSSLVINAFSCCLHYDQNKGPGGAQYIQCTHRKSMPLPHNIPGDITQNTEHWLNENFR